MALNTLHRCFRPWIISESAQSNNEQPVKNGTLDFYGKVADKRRTGRWPGCFPMLGMEIATKIIFFGIVSNLLTYLIDVMHQGVEKSARDANNWEGTIYVSSVLGAFLSDAFWGRYRTMTYAAILYTIGLSCLTISASTKSLQPPSCPAESNQCLQPTGGQSGFFFFGLYLVGFAQGTMTACLMSFGADQFDDSDEIERRQRSSFFNWLMWCLHIGGFISVTALVYLEDHVGWDWGFGTLLIILSLAVIVFFVNTTRYRYRLPEGSPLTKVAQVLVASFTKRKAVVPVGTGKLHEEQPVSGKRLLPHTNQFSFLDKAALQAESTKPSPWKLCTVTRVEETKLVLKMLPIWLATLWFPTAPAQSATFFLRQGMAMNNKLGNFKVPPASMMLFANLGVLVFMPIYDHILVPAMRKVSKNERGISLLQRMGVGMAISIVALIVAALIEIKRRNSTSKISIFWLVPQYFILGLAEGMENTGLLEFFHEQAPDTMHSLGISFALANLGVGIFLSSVLLTCVRHAAPGWLQDNINKGHLDYFYWLLACLSVINLLVLYAPAAHWYSYKAADDYATTVEEPSTEQTTSTNNVV